jgi:hypothetical protein
MNVDLDRYSMQQRIFLKQIAHSWRRLMVWNLLFLSAFRCLLSACNFYIVGGSTVPHRTAPRRHGSAQTMHGKAMRRAARLTMRGAAV